MSSFTPISALIGGGMIGLAAALLLLLNGRIAGVSGILGGLLDGQAGSEKGERIAFFVGLLGGPLLVGLIWRWPQATVAASIPLLIAAGLLVGFGTRLGSGCTSGHGICGVARLSPRSLAATVLFILAGMAAAYAARHLFA
ncbi:MAG TPA: YeeE/YedE family protein [Alphaproteobacteria bacterium]|nr:YeeE/YedE family protein [Alphaproteobacteria bacterium]